MVYGPKPVALLLTEDERARLLGLARRRRTGQDGAMHSRVVLACADPEATKTGIAGRPDVSRQSVVTWRQRFLAHRVEGLSDAPRSGLATRRSSASSH
jgi:hypothetical protein